MTENPRRETHSRSVLAAAVVAAGLVPLAALPAVAAQQAHDRRDGERISVVGEPEPTTLLANPGSFGPADVPTAAPGTGGLGPTTSGSRSFGPANVPTGPGGSGSSGAAGFANQLTR
ncbi:hypothetical protein IL992_29955 [Microbispora sp. NEAU-D428]|uniref:hypothetical protein n=1 Tax=Microbispora sitophila TaxID=2771537 RepID=UPI001865CC8D|nr:hypothetical protein [Microbispora sitophila]MBE3013373.1 hypothetical protein [Microbispora sitophila]